MDALRLFAADRSLVAANIAHNLVGACRHHWRRSWNAGRIRGVRRKLHFPWNLGGIRMVLRRQLWQQYSIGRPRPSPTHAPSPD